MFTTLNNWKFMFFEGIVFCLFGLAALANPYFISVSIEFLLGCFLVGAGIVQGFRALTGLKDPNGVPMLIGSVFALIGGILLLTYPLSGILTLTLILTAFFFVDGVTRMIGSFHYRPLKGWGWLFFSGLFSVLLGYLIVTGWPTSAVWVIGIYFGVYMLFLGITLIMLAYEVKRGMKEVH